MMFFDDIAEKHNYKMLYHSRLRTIKAQIYNPLKIWQTNK